MAPSRAEIALIRHALAAEAKPERVSPLAARRPSRRTALPEISLEVRAEYAYALTERAGRYIEQGLSVAEADRLALNDLGCVEYWDYAANERWREPPERVERIERAGEFTPGDISRQLDLWVRLSLAGAAAAVDGAPERRVEPAVGPPDPALRCSRCESIGHTVEACPFSPVDNDMLRVARLRRERRARRTEVA